MPIMNLLLDIQLRYNQFTKTEKKIADFIVQNADKALFMSISDLSDACKVADASVHRFCRTMGLKGYQEFKMKLSLSMAADNMLNQDAEEKKQGNRLLQCNIEDILEGHLSVIRETHTLLKEEDINRVIQMMEAANNIYFFGIGDSLLTAKEARNKFLRITKKVSCIDDPHMQAMAVSLAGEEDLIFFISYSGSTKDNVYVAKIAREVGAKVVAITRFVKSPLTVYTDSTLLCGSNEGPLEGGSMATKLSQLYIIDVLFQEYYRRNKTLSKENNEKTSRAVVEKLY